MRVRTCLVGGALFVGCSDYGLQEETVSVSGDDTGPSRPLSDSGVPLEDTGDTPRDTDTGCTTDGESWNLEPRWERSAMADRIQTDTLGACMGAASVLETFPDMVWDSGTYTPDDRRDEGLSAARSWASWDQLAAVDCHLFSLTIELPACGWSGVELTSPWFGGVPINDNLYVLVDGVLVWEGGTSYGIVNGDGPAETDGWLESPIEALPATLLGSGVVTIDLVVEEHEQWGGMGFIEPVLVP